MVFQISTASAAHSLSDKEQQLCFTIHMLTFDCLAVYLHSKNIWSTSFDITLLNLFCSVCHDFFVILKHSQKVVRAASVHW